MKNKINRALLATLTYSLILSVNRVVRADTIDTFEGLLDGIVKIMLPIAIGALGIPLVIINAYKLMVSEGDPQKARDAKEGLTAAIIGLMFLFFSMTILRLILSGFFGV